MRSPENPDDVAWSVTLTMNIRRGEDDDVEGAPIAMFIGSSPEEATEKAQTFLKMKKSGMYLPMPEPQRCGTYKTPWGLVWSVRG